MTGPLKGFRVIDLSQYIPGPYTTRLLCDLGAEVIKIESPGGDPLFHMFSQDGKSPSPVYQLLNAGKTVARLNLKDSDCVEQLRNLVSEADVLLESFRPGVAARLGFGVEYLHELNPALIYCSLSGFGQDGPLGNMAGHDINYCAAAGMFSFTDHPVPGFPLIADHSGAVNAVNGILAGLLGRTQSGQGAKLDITLYESMLGWQYPATTGTSGPSNTTLIQLTGGAACYNIYQTADQRHITLGALESHFWGSFCDALNQPQWIKQQHNPLPQIELISEVRQHLSGMTLAELNLRLDGVDCCYMPVPLSKEIFQQPQVKYRQTMGSGKLAFPGRMDNHRLANNETVKLLPPAEIPCWSRKADEI